MNEEQKRALIGVIESIFEDFDAEDVERMEKVVEFYCGTFNILDGLKTALRQQLNDDKTNLSDIEDKDLVKVFNILTQ